MGQGRGGPSTRCSSRHFKPRSSSKFAPMDLNGAASSDGFISHHVSKLDTLAGIAIKHGVEVADIKRLNGLTTDLQMYARKTLRIPSQGKHAPSEQHYMDASSSNGHADFQPRLGKHSFSPSFVGNDVEVTNVVGKRKVSPAMGLLRGYYGLGSPGRKDAEGTEMDVYRAENGGYQSDDEPFTPRDKLSTSKLKPPLDRSLLSGGNEEDATTMVTPSVSSFNSMVSMARDFVVGEIEKVAVRRRPKGDWVEDNKQEFFSGGKGSGNGIPRPRSSSGSQGSRFGVEVEVDCPTVRALVFNSNGGSTGGGGSGMGKLVGVGGKVVEELIFKLKKSSSTPNFEDEKQPFIQKNGSKADLTALSSGSAAAAAAAAASPAGGIPLLDSFTRRSKTALD